MRPRSHPTVAHAIPALFCVCTALTACGGTHVEVDYSTFSDPRKQEIVIGIEDKLNIRVRNNEDYPVDVTVRPDGAITLPLIGSLRAEGKTPSRLQKEIADRLSQFVRDPQQIVTVSVAAYNSYKFTVTGEVVQPGVYGAQQFVKVLDAIQMAGGPTRFARKEEVRVIRCCDESGEKMKIPINFDAVLKGNIEMNIFVLPGDLILVP
jgi:polysaccharide export outer membrane protein